MSALNLGSFSCIYSPNSYHPHPPAPLPPQFARLSSSLLLPPWLRMCSSSCCSKRRSRARGRKHRLATAAVATGTGQSARKRSLLLLPGEQPGTPRYAFSPLVVCRGETWRRIPHVLLRRRRSALLLHQPARRWQRNRPPLGKASAWRHRRPANAMKAGTGSRCGTRRGLA